MKVYIRSVKLHFPARVIPAIDMTVERCGECPCCASNQGMGEPAICTHPEAPKGFYENATGIWCAPPEWCPARV